ncbi:MAG: hypothetical protein H7X70_07130 [Candidatus Kapabacteria bacterium]|nr:hypothetical protein [Candidatus Kapabacteria bacterium]
MDIRKENGKRETLRFYSDENLILDSLDVGDSIELFKYSDSMATKQHNSSLWVIFSKSQGLR